MTEEPERREDDPAAPSGLPDEEAEETPLGVPPDADPQDQPSGPEAMPGIPTEGDPPAAS